MHQSPETPTYPQNCWFSCMWQSFHRHRLIQTHMIRAMCRHVEHHTVHVKHVFSLPVMISKSCNVQIISCKLGEPEGWMNLFASHIWCTGCGCPWMLWAALVLSNWTYHRHLFIELSVCNANRVRPTHLLFLIVVYILILYRHWW